MKSIQFLAALALSVANHAIAWEYDISCGASSTAHYPSLQVLNPSNDDVSRFVFMGMEWNSVPLLLVNSGLGMEFKSYYYNYDDAAVNGKGPSFVQSTAIGGYFDYDLPGCYIDSDWLSHNNSAGEYEEPQVGFGITPGYGGNIIIGREYTAVTRVGNGRGNSSLVKMRDNTTKLVMPGIGPSGIFLCADIPGVNYIIFAQGVRAPTCAVGYPGAAPVKRCQ
jgi:hypothetical protein